MCSAALAPESLARMRFPLGEHARSRRSASSPARPGWRWPGAATRRTCVFWRAPATATSSSATAAGQTRPGRSSTATARRSASTAALTSTPSASATASASRRARAALRARHRRALEHRHRRPARGAASRAVSVREVTLHRDGALRGRRARPRPRPRASPAAFPASLAPGATRALAVELAEPAERTAPGQLACLYSASWSSATAPSRPERRGAGLRSRRSDDLR